MDIRRNLTASAIAVGTMATAAAGVTSALAAPTSHTLHVTAIQLKSKNFNNIFVQDEKDLQNGTVTGYDVVTCVGNNSTKSASCDATLARKNGLLYVHATVSFNTGRGSGTVTGGTRAYKGATGTITLAPGANQSQTKLTITYST